MNPDPGTVLVCTASTIRDPGVDMVMEALEARGANAFRFDTDRFPADIHLTVGWDAEDHVLLSDSEMELDLGRVSAVWIRGMDAGAKQPAHLDAGHQDIAEAESMSMIWGLLESLNAFQLDPPDSLRSAPHKPRQLQLARALGLEIPRTVITTDPRAVRELAKTCPHGLISKMVDGCGVRLETEQGLQPIYTTHLSAEDLEQLDGLKLCPMIFQESIPKARELRITVVGARAFVAAVDSSGSALGADDWRKDDGLRGGFRPYEDCPKVILDRIFALLDRVGLNFATIDMIVTPDGRHVFLELNTISGFAFIERSTGLPIASAIADLLTGVAPSRISQRRGT